MRRGKGASGARNGAALALVALLAVSLAGCDGGSRGERSLELRGETMGTYWVARVVAGEGCPSDAAPLRERIQAALEAVDARMSTWRPESELSLLNEAAATDPQPVSEELHAVLAEAAAVSELSDGAFDVTVGPLVDAWGFGPPGRPAVPPDVDTLAALAPRIGWRQVGLAAAPPTVAKGHPDLEIDLSAIAKGYGVDRGAEALREAGCRRFLLEVGGEVVTSGLAPEGRPWRVGIERPGPGPRGLERVVPLVDLAMATSGDYRNYLELDGRRVSHTIDPRTREPIRHDVASVSVVAETCMRADALATALLVLGPEGLALAEREGIAALFLRRQGDGFVDEATSAWKDATTPKAG